MMTLSKSMTGVASLVFGLGAAATAAMAQNLDGRWAATTVQGGVTIPFRLDISGNGNQLTGKLYNGADDTETTTSASFQNGKVELNFEHYLTSIQATAANGELDGNIVVTRRTGGEEGKERDGNESGREDSRREDDREEDPPEGGAETMPSRTG